MEVLSLHSLDVESGFYKRLGSVAAVIVLTAIVCVVLKYLIAGNSYICHGQVAGSQN